MHLPFNTTSLTEKCRNIIDMIIGNGFTIAQDEGKQSVHDLRGAGRVTVQYFGQRRDYTIQSSGAEITIGSWRGQFESPVFAKGAAKDVDRILNNASTISAIVSEEKAIEVESQRQPAAPLPSPMRPR